MKFIYYEKNQMAQVFNRCFPYMVWQQNGSYL
jgi:hypothetical protein